MRPELLKFLLGEAPLDGVWFGQRHPTRRSEFWWREVLREQAAKEDSAAYQAMKLLAKAEQEGVVVTIEQRPLKPLAMGHYVSIANIRAKRNRAAPTA